MPKYSKHSRSLLSTCHKDLQVLFNEVIKYFNNTILYGHRTPEEQFILFKKGRVQKDGIWVIDDRSKVVTYKDGHEKLSMHNYYPSKAVDACPYPIDFNNTKRIIYFAGFVKGLARELYECGIIDHDIIWGGDWNDNTILKDQHFHDLLHFQIKE